MRVRLGGRYWELRFVPNLRNDGEVDFGMNLESRIIRVRLGQSAEDMLDTIVHEALHASRPELDEDAVTKTANDVSRLLYRLGYRRQSRQ
jgi:hypothetical protein